MAHPSNSQSRRAIVAPDANGHATLRLLPIEKPRGLLLRLAYWASMKRFGQVPSGMKVVVARVPRLLNISKAAHTLDRSLSVDKETAYLAGLAVATINGCNACTDLARMTAVMKGMDLEKFHAVGEYKTSPLFSPRQRAALAYAGEVTRTVAVSDATFDALRPHFNDQEIAELTVIIAFQNMANRINVPLGIGSDGLCEIVQARRSSRA